MSDYITSKYIIAGAFLKSNNGLDLEVRGLDLEQGYQTYGLWAGIIPPGPWLFSIPLSLPLVLELTFQMAPSGEGETWLQISRHAEGFLHCKVIGPSPLFISSPCGDQWV